MVGNSRLPGGPRDRCFRLRRAAAATPQQQRGSGGGPASGEIAGAGSTAQEAAQEAWTAEFENANSGATISYDAVGSGGGREQFIAGGVAFAGSDAALSTEEGELNKAASAASPASWSRSRPTSRRSRSSTTSKASKSCSSIRKRWRRSSARRSPAGTTRRSPKTTPDAELPDTRITPVNRSDESGTTQNFTEYLSEVDPSVWSYEVSGDWPVKGGEAARAPPAWSKRSPPAKARSATPTPARPANSGSPRSRSASEYAEPTPEAAAKIARAVAGSQGTEEVGPYMFPFELDRKTESQGTYPIVLVSYLIGCTEVRARPAKRPSSRATSNTRSAAKASKWPPKTPVRHRSRRR